MMICLWIFVIMSCNGQVITNDWNGQVSPGGCYGTCNWTCVLGILFLVKSWLKWCFKWAGFFFPLIVHRNIYYEYWILAYKELQIGWVFTIPLVPFTVGRFNRREGPSKVGEVRPIFWVIWSRKLVGLVGFPGLRGLWVPLGWGGGWGLVGVKGPFSSLFTPCFATWKVGW